VLSLAYVVADQFVVEIPSVSPELVTQAHASSDQPEPTENTATEDAASTTAPDGGYGLGRPALPEEIAAWDVDVLPDGTGLPEGSGDVATGESVFAAKCASCHGDFAEGVGNWPKLAGGEGTLADKDPVKTVGSYWPYLSTTWDYVHRSMPFGDAQSLTNDEVYAITAYILYSNYLVEDDFTLSHENFTDIELPNADGFIVDDRAETEYPLWTTEPCMSDCKDNVEITMRARVLDVTPEEEETEAGPVLTGIVDAPAGAVDGFRYSNALEAAAEDGLIWTEAELSAFLAKPRAYLKGTKMSFAGLRKEADQKAIIAYLRSVSE